MDIKKKKQSESRLNGFKLTGLTNSSFVMKTFIYKNSNHSSILKVKD